MAAASTHSGTCQGGCCARPAAASSKALPVTPRQAQRFRSRWTLLAGIALFLALAAFLPLTCVAIVTMSVLALATCMHTFMLLADAQRLSKLTMQGGNSRRPSLLLAAAGAGGSPLSLLNLRLSLVDGDFASADYQLLLRLDAEVEGAGLKQQQAVPESHLALLPVHAHLVSAQNTMPQPHQRSCCQCGQEEPVCTVCQDCFAEGSQVLTLPCSHQFHAGCVTQWLRLKGMEATCPNCKAHVFQHQPLAA